MDLLKVVLIVALVAYACFAAWRTHTTIKRKRAEEEEREWPNRRRLP